jgi:hypothetical protein
LAAPQNLIDAIDRIIEYFNKRTLDLPDGFFDRRTQFVINGAPFETLLGRSPDDPLILMLARGPAGYRFAIKALQHAMPDALIRAMDSSSKAESVGASGVNEFVFQLRLSGNLRGTGEAVDIFVPITLKRGAAGEVMIAEATIEPMVLEKIRHARLLP